MSTPSRRKGKLAPRMQLAGKTIVFRMSVVAWGAVVDAFRLAGGHQMEITSPILEFDNTSQSWTPSENMVDFDTWLDQYYPGWTPGTIHAIDAWLLFTGGHFPAGNTIDLTRAAWDSVP